MLIVNILFPTILKRTKQQFNPTILTDDILKT